MFKDLLVRKPIDQLMKESANTRELKRVLGPLNLTTLGIGAIIGAGIFVLTGQAAAQYAGPAIVFSFIFSGIGAAMAALCYAEFSSTVPISGSAYTYAYVTLGELFAWIIGWDLMLEYLFGASTVAVGWSGYVVSFLEDFGITIPSYLSSAPFTYDPVLGWQTTGAFLNIPAMFIVAFMTILLVIGIKESAVFNNIIVLVKISVLLLFITFGIAYINTGNWVPFIPPNTGEFGHFGLSGILRGAGVIFFAYFGFDAVSTAAQEARNPKKDMPIGILSSLAVSTVLYIAVSLVLTGMVKYDQLLVPDPIAVAVNAAGPGLFWLRPFVKIGAIAGLSSVVLVLLLSQPRIFYTMAKDGLLPKRFASIHPRFKTPYITTILTGTIAMFVSGLFPIEVLGALVSIGTLLAFAIVCSSVLVLRHTQPDLPRPFKTPFVPWVPVLGALFSFAQMLALPVDTWLRLLIWMGIGIIIYASYGRKHSKALNMSRNKNY
ncbi:MAG: amino acid permease [Candidatus Methanoperedens sp.]|nr:amino acid permease [Candidatus Methanoperedens sp.]